MRDKAVQWSENTKKAVLSEMVAETRPTSILLVEDDGALREFLAETLWQKGYEVIQAKNGMEAMALLGYESFRKGGYFVPEIVITDVYMPGATGLELLERLRGSDGHTKVILISAFANGEIYEEAKRLGGACVIEKPFNLREFLQTVELLAS